jgi:DNA repair exonuclease SbcCD nuclease subunit
MLTRALKICLFSDVHLGHRRTPTDSIISNLKKEIPDAAESSDIDIIMITGDLFDRFLSLPNDEVFEIHSWCSHLLRMCKKRDIVLRVLEGTPSHDWKQSRLIESINNGGNIGADVKFVPTLSIEWNERFGINLLYIPDEWSHDNDDTWKQVKLLLKEHHLTEVDFVLMHGQFAYQLPPHVAAPVHDPDRYSKITKHYVFCGHVHKPSRYKNVIVPGSFDRLTHGEEEDKGSWIITVNPEGDDQVVFKANEGSTKFVSVDCTGRGIEDALMHVDLAVASLPIESHVRLRASTSDPIAASIDVLRRKYPSYHWSSKIENTAKMKEVIQDMRAKYQTQPITPTTIDALLKAQLMTIGLDEEAVTKCLETFNEVSL